MREASFFKTMFGAIKMVKVLVADTCKSSLVMTSEIFKDKIPGCTVVIALTGAECVELSQTQKFDMIIADFDLPDADGVNLTHVLRQTYDGPIVLTAYPEKIVNEAIKSELFAYVDSMGWVPKPVKFDVLEGKIEEFILKKRRVTKRFHTDFSAIIIGKGEGRGKRSPKITGNMNTLSVKGASMILDGEMKSIKVGDEIIINVDVPEDMLTGKVIAKQIEVKIEKSVTKKSKSTAVAKKSKNTPTIKIKTTKFKATVAWTNKNKTEAGFEFKKLTSGESRQIENVLRSYAS